MSKILDFLDTTFMILRRKWRQVSFLHVYHHFSIFMVSGFLSLYVDASHRFQIYWLNANVGFDGDIYFTVVLNSFIHAVMYFYYACTSVTAFVYNTNHH